MAALRGFLGAHNLLTGSWDRDFRTLRGLLGALLTTFLRPSGLQSSQIWSSEFPGGLIVLDLVLSAHDFELREHDFLSLLSSSPLDFL